MSTEVNIRPGDPDGPRNQDLLADWSSVVTWLWLWKSQRREQFHDSQSQETVKYGHESREIRNQEWLCWRGPAAIYQTRPELREVRDSESIKRQCEMPNNSNNEEVISAPLHRSWTCLQNVHSLKIHEHTVYKFCYLSQRLHTFLRWAGHVARKRQGIRNGKNSI
jgi:hypothetical protein